MPPASAPLPSALALHLEHLADRVPALIAVYDVRSGQYVYVNKAFTKILGYAPEDLLGGGVDFAQSLVHPDDLQGLTAENSRALARAATAHGDDEEPIASFEYRMRHKKGHWIWLHTEGSVLQRDEPGKVGYVMTVSVDITDHKETEQQLRQVARALESQIEVRTESLELALNASKLGVWHWNAETGDLYWSDQHKRIYGLDPSKHVTYEEYIASLHPDERASVVATIKKAQKNSKPYQIEHRITWPDGTEHWVLGQGQAIFRGGKAVRLLGTSMLIDERKQVEQDTALRAEVLENMVEGVSVSDENGFIIYTNSAEDAMFGYERGELVGQHVTVQNSYPPKENRRILQNIIEQLTHEGSWSGEFSNVKKDGTPFTTLARMSTITTGGRRLLVCVQEDITKRKSTEERLLLAQKAGKIGAYEWDFTTNRIMWAPELEELYGLPEGTYDGTYDGWISRVHPDDAEQAASIVERAIRENQPMNTEFRVLWPDGSVRWLLARGTLVKDEHGRPLRFVGINMDITERTQLMQLNKAKDEFISIASHQLRTPASAVKQYIGMLVEGFAGELTPEQRQYAEKAFASNERQLNIIKDLLQVARIDAGKVRLNKSACDAVELLRHIVQEQQAKFREREQKLEFVCRWSHVTADIDPERMRMAIENLLDNASKYSHPHSLVQVCLTRTKDAVHIKIKDHGVGIAEGDLVKLYTKFTRFDNSLSHVVGGSGLGLYWAKCIVDLHDGTITVASTLNKGTEFTINLPRISK